MKYELQHCISSRLRKLSRIADGHMRNCLKEFGITENQMTILFALSKLGKVEQGKIGETLVLERSTVSRNVKLLEKQKLVRRTAAYRPEIELTNKGVELVNKLIPHWEKVMDSLVEMLGDYGTVPLEKLEQRIK
ncbi:MAG: DNA-binding MarR family transcriptional regulator [Dokdonia sp.]|jgi:DNA-binding MarR family transcriptional regulator